MYLLPGYSHLKLGDVSAKRSIVLNQISRVFEKVL